MSQIKKKTISMGDSVNIGDGISYEIPELEGIFAKDHVYLQDMARHFLIIGETGSGKTVSAVMPILRSIVKKPDNAILLIDPKNNELRNILRQQLGEREYAKRVVDMELNAGRFIDFHEGKRDGNYSLEQRVQSILALSPSIQNSSKSSTNREWLERSKQFLSEIIQLDMDLRSYINKSLWRILIDAGRMSKRGHYFDHVYEFIRGLKKSPDNLKAIVACIKQAVENAEEMKQRQIQKQKLPQLEAFQQICKAGRSGRLSSPLNVKVVNKKLSRCLNAALKGKRDRESISSEISELFPVISAAAFPDEHNDWNKRCNMFQALSEELDKAEQLSAPAEYFQWLGYWRDAYNGVNDELPTDGEADAHLQLLSARLNELGLSLTRGQSSQEPIQTPEEDLAVYQDSFIGMLLRWYEFQYLEKKDIESQNADNESEDDDTSEVANRITAIVDDIRSLCQGDLFRRVHDFAIGIEPLLSELCEPYLKERIWLDPIEPPANIMNIKNDVILRKKILVYSPDLSWSSGSIVGKILKQKFYQATFATHVSGERNFPVFYICDEFQRYITTDEESGEQSFLDRCRAYRAVCVLCTQSLSSLHYAVGGDSAAIHSIAVLLNNTANKLFFRTTDPATQEWLYKVWPMPPMKGMPHLLSVRPLTGLSVGECYALSVSGGKAVRHQIRLQHESDQCQTDNDLQKERDQEAIRTSGRGLAA